MSKYNLFLQEANRLIEAFKYNVDLYTFATDHSLENKQQIPQLRIILFDIIKSLDVYTWILDEDFLYEIYDEIDCGDFGLVSCGVCGMEMFRFEAFLDNEYLYTCNDCVYELDGFGKE